MKTKSYLTSLHRQSAVQFFFPFSLMVFALIFLSAQMPNQRKLRQLERQFGKRKPAVKDNYFKAKKKAKKSAKKKSVVSKKEKTKIKKHYSKWRKEYDALKKRAKNGDPKAQYELARRREIEVHMIRVAKLRTLHRYAHRERSKGLEGKTKMLMAEENTRFEKAMRALEEKFVSKIKRFEERQKKKEKENK